MIGNATRKALAKNERNAPSRKTFMKRSGIHPMGAVFLIMN
jgi:hypothetical protein